MSRNVGLDALGQSFTVTLNGLFCLFSRILSRDYSTSSSFFLFSPCEYFLEGHEEEEEEEEEEKEEEVEEEKKEERFFGSS